MLSDKVHTSHLLETYWLSDRVHFWEDFCIWKGTITLPRRYEQIEWGENIWFIFLLLAIAHFDDQEIQKYTHTLLQEHEIQQLKNVFIFLKVYQKSRRSFFDKTEKYIQKTLDAISENITNTGSLWMFIKEKLQTKQVWSFEELVHEYIQFTQSLLESTKNNQTVEDKDNNGDDSESEETKQEPEWIEAHQEYSEHEWFSKERANEDSGIFWVIQPAVGYKYFYEQTLSIFNHKTGKFIQANAQQQKLEQTQPEKTNSIYTYPGKKWKIYHLPIDIHHLSVYNWNREEVEVFQDASGNYSLRFLQTCKTQIGIWKDPKIFESVQEEDTKKLYTGNKIDTSKFKTPQDILHVIQTTKKYKNISQSQLNTKNINHDTEVLFAADEFDCLPANKLFVILCRNIWFPARLITGIVAYNATNTKENTRETILSKTRWHAWSEVYIEGKWKIFDATPIKKDSNEQENNNQDLLKGAQEIMDTLSEEKPEDIDTFELRENIQEKVEHIHWDLENSIENIHFRSALEFVRDDAEEIIHHLQNIIENRKKIRGQQILWMQRKRKKWGLSTGDLRIDSRAIQRLSVWNTSIFTQKSKQKLTPNQEVQLQLQDLSLAIDISGSMWKLTGNWECWKKADYAYLSLVLLSLIAEKLDINFTQVTLFWDRIYTWSVPEIIETFCTRNEYNHANAEGIETCLKNIEHSSKWLAIVLSDWDLYSGSNFFNEQSKEILKKNPNIFILWYGMGKTASARITHKKAENGYTPTVIEYQMKEAENPKQAKWYPLEIYKNVVNQLKKDFTTIITQSNIDLEK